MAQIFSFFSSPNLGHNRWNRGILLLGGACLAGSLAFLWYLRKPSTPSKTKAGSKQHSTTVPLKECEPGIKGSLEMKQRGNNLFQKGKYMEAVEAFTTAISLCPENELTHLAVCYQNRAAALERIGNLRDTVRDCSTALKLNPQYHKAGIRRAKAYSALKEPENALDDFMYAYVLDQSKAEDYKAETDQVLEEVCKNFIDNLEKTRESIPIRDELVLLWQSCYVNDPVLHDLKHIFDKEGFYHQALQAVRDRRYEEVIDLLEKDIASGLTDAFESLRDYIFIIRFSLMKENMKVMKIYLDKFAKLWAALDDEAKNDSMNKHCRAMYYLLCASLKMLLNNGSFIEDIKRAIEADENNVDVYLGAYMLLSENGQLPLALEYLEQLTSIDPKHHLVNHMKANCDLALKASIGDVAGVFAAINQVDKLLQGNPNADPILHLITGRLYFAAQNTELAKASFQKAAEDLVDFSAPIFYLALVETDEMEGDSNQMDFLEKKMKLCLEKEEANPDALSVLAKVAFHRSEFKEAQQLLKQAISMCPLKTNKAGIMQMVSDYVRICSLCKAVGSFR